MSWKPKIQVVLRLLGDEDLESVSLALGVTAARATVYDRREPKTAYTDAHLTEHIRHVIATAPFTGEGYRKVWARLRLDHAVRVGRRRVLRLMRERDLLAPQRPGTPHGPHSHDGTIVADAPD